MRDVASVAKVSLATVSFVVNNTKPVRAETRARVERAMEMVGYRQNAVARALASRRTRVIALLFPLDERSVARSVYSFFVSAAARAQELGYTLVVSPAGASADDVAELMGSGLVEGVIVMEVRLEDPRVDYLMRSNLPFALIGRTARPDEANFVDIDFENTVSEALDALVELGHDHVLLLDSLTEGNLEKPSEGGYAPSIRVRRAFLERTESLGIHGLTLGCAMSAEGGMDAARIIQHAHPDTTAVIVHNELAAAGLATGLRVEGLRVPADLSIVLIDSTIEMAAMVDPRLEVWATPADDLGRMGVEALVGILDGGDPRPQTLISCVRVPGASVSVPRRT